MRKSMTAYGRAALQTKRARWIVEISSVNRKGLDFHTHLPPVLLFLDPLLRKWTADIAERGSITIRVSCEMKEASHLIENLGNEKKRWEKVARALGYLASDVTLSFLLQQTSVQEMRLDETSFEKEVEQVWKKAAKSWTAMKRQEGKALAQDVEARLKAIEKEIKEIEKNQPLLLKEHLAKLHSRVEELKLTVDPSAIEKEAALQVVRDDVTEEMVRLKSHMEQMTFYLKSPEESVGRTLDFLAQEMGREIGTLMAKAGSSDIARSAVRIKGEIEKIREQIQNIE